MLCRDCGAQIPKAVGRGRQRTYCEICSPPRRKKPPAPRQAADKTDPPTACGSIHAATLATLEQAGRTDTPLGATALLLAQRLDADQDSGSAMAAMAKQLGATLEDATRGAQIAMSPLDELRARRDAKLA